MSINAESVATRRGLRALFVGGGAVVVAAGVASALMFGGAASATSGEHVDPSIRQLPGGSWIAEDTFQEEAVLPDEAAPDEMVEEGSTVDPGSDMLGGPIPGQL